MSATPIEFYAYEPGVFPCWQPAPNKDNQTTISEISIATWNVWYDRLEQWRRFQGFLKELRKHDNIDILCLQEVTSSFFQWLQDDDSIRATWLLTDRWDANHRQTLADNWYGNMILVKRRFSGYVSGSIMPFQTSRMGRYAMMAKLTIGKDSQIRIANAHLDSPIGDTAERKHQMKICHAFLTEITETSSPETDLFILCGDLNIFTTAELNENTLPGFKDSILGSSLEPLVESSASATLGLTFALPDYAPRRSDFVLWKSRFWDCASHYHFGLEPVREESGLPSLSNRGNSGHLFPSDHLGVAVKFTRKDRDSD